MNYSYVVEISLQKRSSAEIELSLCFALFPQWNEERFNIHLISQRGRGLFDMLMAEIMQNLRKISFICTSKTYFCILLDGIVVSPVSAAYLNLLFHRKPCRGLPKFP